MTIDMSVVNDVHQILKPCPSVGEGVHHAILGAVSELALLGYSPEEIPAMIEEWVEAAGTTPYPREIPDAMEKVFGDGDPRLTGKIFKKAATWPESDFSAALDIAKENGARTELECLYNLTDASPIDFDSKDLNLTTEDWLDLFYRDDDLRWLDLRSYRFHPFDVQAAVILYLRNLQKVKLLSVVQSGNEHGSLHALWKADPDESVNRDFMRTAVSIGMDKSLWTLSQFARIFNPGAPQYQEIFYFGYVMSK